MARNRISGNSNHEFEIPDSIKPDRGLKVKLDVRRRAKYDVWQKDIPKDIPTSVTIDGGVTFVKVNWFNNFGLKRRKPNNSGTRDTDDSDEFLGTVDTGDEYDLEVVAETGKRYFVHTGGNTARELTIAGGKASIRLAAGDPPIGDGIK